jgi:hypothetical protein
MMLIRIFIDVSLVHISRIAHSQVINYMLPRETSNKKNSNFTNTTVSHISQLLRSRMVNDKQ